MRSRYIVAAVLITGISFFQFRWHYGPWAVDASTFVEPAVEDNHPEPARSGVTLTADGKLDQILSDNINGEHAQQFTLRLPSGAKVLVMHNVDVASRIPDLIPGEAVRIHGEYEWNESGGIVRSTHRDPSGKFDAGWIEYRGQRYD
jgi:Protein of unknown function (DUF3465)